MVELLAPAGSLEAFYGAVHAGADAVYLGGKKYSARAYAANFSQEQLAACIRYAHLWGRKVYYTSNVLLMDGEWEEAIEEICFLARAGLDGVIVQDMALFSLCRSRLPGLEVHASTQMSLSGPYSARCLERWGFDRAVPARELRLEEIEQIQHAAPGLDLEVFIHGAMCYAYSGRCLYSSFLGGRSGNRGSCAGPCRLAYGLEGEGALHRLSLKDLCSLEFLPRLLERGISAFKIEGRMKKPAYAAGTSKIYQKYIKMCNTLHERLGGWPGESRELAGLWNREYLIDRQDLEDLRSLYLRPGAGGGYFFPQGEEHYNAQPMTLDQPSSQSPDPELALRLEEEFVSYKPRKILDMEAYFAPGQRARLRVGCQGIYAEALGELVQPAQSRPLDAQNIEKQLQKLGESIFSLGHMDIHLEGSCFYSLQGLNALRRMAIERMEEALLAEYAAKAGVSASGLPEERTPPLSTAEDAGGEIFAGPGSLLGAAGPKPPAPRGRLRLRIQRTAQWEALLAHPAWLQAVDRLYIHGDLLVGGGCTADGEAQRLLGERISRLETLWAERMQGFALEGRPAPQCFLSLPPILRAYDADYLELCWEALRSPVFSGCQVQDLEGWGFLEEKGYGRAISAGPSIYIWNSLSLGFWAEKAQTLSLPLELGYGQSRDLAASHPAVDLEKMVYGHIPMMISASCAIKSGLGCKKFLRESWRLTDRKGKKLPLVTNCRHCMNILYNPLPLSLHAYVGRWRERANLLLDFTIEDGAAMGVVLEYFGRLACHPAEPAPPDWEYTTGHEKQGMERQDRA